VVKRGKGGFSHEETFRRNPVKSGEVYGGDPLEESTPNQKAGEKKGGGGG